MSVKVPESNYISRDSSLSALGRIFPTFSFYFSLVWIVLTASFAVRRNKYKSEQWVSSSQFVLRKIEEVGVRLEVSGLSNLEKLEGPSIIVGNHMSMMETLILPGFLQPIKELTFVVKDSLLEYPIFKHIMRSRDPVAITRTNPRQDLKTVMNDGCDRLENGISIVVFPQTTRSHTFEPAQMSSIGVKLAKKAGVPVIPLALKTDCWENGKWLKDFGRINPAKKAYFAFGQPIMVEGKGNVEQEMVNSFIEEKLAQWAD